MLSQARRNRQNDQQPNAKFEINRAFPDLDYPRMQPTKYVPIARLTDLGIGTIRIVIKLVLAFWLVRFGGNGGGVEPTSGPGGASKLATASATLCTSSEPAYRGGGGGGGGGKGGGGRKSRREGNQPRLWPKIANTVEWVPWPSYL